MDHRGPYRCFDAETLITAFQVLLSNHFCILLAMWSPYASLIQLWDCYKKQCLKSGYVISAAVLLPTKPITLSQEEIILVTQFVLEKPMVAATQILLSPRCIHAKCSTICFRVFFFLFFSQISHCFYFIFPFREGAKTKSCGFGEVDTDNAHPTCEYCLR